MGSAPIPDARCSRGRYPGQARAALLTLHGDRWVEPNMSETLRRVTAELWGLAEYPSRAEAWGILLDLHQRGETCDTLLTHLRACTDAANGARQAFKSAEGARIAGALPPHMEDYYDSQVRASTNGTGELQTRYVKLIELVNEFRNSPQEEIYRHPNFEQACHIIVPDFEQINLELIEYFSKHPAELPDLRSGRKFEELLAEIFRNQGFDTELGPGWGDGGVDIRLLQKDPIGELVTVVQAKKYAKNPIRLEAVQALFAVVEDQQANRGLFVTTSRYLPGAKEFAERHSRRLTLATSEDVARWCRSICERRR